MSLPELQNVRRITFRLQQVTDSISFERSVPVGTRESREAAGTDFPCTSSPIGYSGFSSSRLGFHATCKAWCRTKI